MRLAPWDVLFIRWPRQLTVRGVSPELAAALEELSTRRQESVNSTVLSILKQAVGIDERRNALARYTTWTEEDANEFDSALASQRVIDEDLWR